jgi:hypothetical protein
MVNTSAPFGFRQFGQREGSAPTAGLEIRFISSAYTGPVFTGDVVKQSSASPPYIVSANSSTGTGGIATAITDTAFGIFLGCEYYNTNVNRVTWSSYWPGSGATGDVKCTICSNPEQLYIAQGSSGGVLGTSNIGQAIPYSITGSSAGNTLSGQSISFVQSSLVTGLSSNGQFMIVDVYSNYAPPGVNGTSTTAEGLQIVVLQPLNFIRRTITAAAGPPASLISS